ncbi:uncharacterized protein GIQ15_05021 [Arthroderma uncinatum]|uniref:uncharacterized protein n=1 Tax=Arthroderma uncinatum TaxID=74035 RepID=UPI00144AE871|nr:uncharacterized protein GIQ15_05021 [Arthroderma uncinatum]KAF3482262.1 hypothetical protein GIQ15_05021 [Arthroderma uncinatum]
MKSKGWSSTDEPDALIDESSYREYVLQLAEDRLEEKEEEELERLRQNALDLGLPIKDNRESYEAVSEGFTASTSTSTTAMSASQVTIPSSMSSTSARVSSCAPSVSSLATCPAIYNGPDARYKFSIFNYPPSRHSFDASYYQDHRFSPGFRQSIFSKFSYFKKRSSMSSALPSKSQSTINTSQTFPNEYLPEAREEITPSPEVPITPRQENAAKAARLEERDLVAEISLVAELQREKQALQTSIRHMEAYFNTPPPSLSSSKNDFYKNLQPRELTDQKRNRLYQSYHELNTLDALHESKIKVLRDKQTRNFQERLRNMELDAVTFAKMNESALHALEKRRRDEISDAIAWLDCRKRRLIYKWSLEEGIARKQLEIETKQTYGPLPAISFDESDYDNYTTDLLERN